MNRVTIAIGLVTILQVMGCDERRDRRHRYSLSFLAVDDRGESLGNIPIQVGQTNIGITNEMGVLQAEVQASDGERFVLRAPCPDGYDAEHRPKEVMFLDTRGLAGEKNASIELQIECKRRSQVAAVLVHAKEHEGLPVLLDGVVYGKTGPGGFAHVRFEGIPNTPFEISLDTSEEARLVPQNPRQQMQLGSEDGLFIFEPVFSEAQPENSTKARRKRRGRRTLEEKPNESMRPIKVD